MTESRNLIPKIGLAITACFFLYGWVTVGPSQTGSPVEVLGFAGATLLYSALLATFSTIFIAARRAYRAGSWFWFIAVIFLWPLSYLYALAVNRNG